MIKTKRIKIPLYFGTLVLHQVDDMNEITKKYRFKDTDTIDGGTFFLSDKMEFHLVLAKGVITPRLINVINIY